jgi:hypothetical protein
MEFSVSRKEPPTRRSKRHTRRWLSSTILTETEIKGRSNSKKPLKNSKISVRLTMS